MAAGDASLAYDEIPYPSAPYPYSHCDHLAIVARLFGIQAADVRQCRVVEVGCADGANLIPMALTLPQGRFVGIDVSARQIAAAAAIVEKLGLTNIELIRQDESLPSDQQIFGEFSVHDCYARLGEKDKAFEALEACFDESQIWHQIKFRWQFDAYRDDPRYQALLKRARLNP